MQNNENQYHAWEEILNKRISELKQKLYVLCQIHLTTEEYKKLSTLINPTFNHTKNLKIFSTNYPLLYCRFMTEVTHRCYNPYSGKLWTNLKKELEETTKQSFTTDKRNYPSFYPEAGVFFRDALQELACEFPNLKTVTDAKNKYAAPLIVHSGIPANCIEPLLSALSLKESIITLDEIDKTFLEDKINYKSHISKYSKNFLLNNNVGIMLVKQLVRLYLRLKKEEQGVAPALEQLKLLPTMVQKVRKFIAGSEIIIDKGQKKNNIEERLIFDSETRDLKLLVNINQPYEVANFALVKEEEKLKSGQVINNHLEIDLSKPKLLDTTLELYLSNETKVYKTRFLDDLDLLMFSKEGVHISLDNKLKPGLYWVLFKRSFIKENVNLKESLAILEEKSFSTLGWNRSYVIYYIELAENTNLNYISANKNIKLNVDEERYNIEDLMFFTGENSYCKTAHRSILADKFLLFTGEKPPTLYVTDEVKEDYLCVVKYFAYGQWKDITTEAVEIEVKEIDGYTYFCLQGEFINKKIDQGFPLFLEFNLEDYNLAGKTGFKRVIWFPRLKVYQPAGILASKQKPFLNLEFPCSVKLESTKGILKKDSKNSYTHYLSNKSRQGELVISFSEATPLNFQLFWQAKGNFKIIFNKLDEKLIKSEYPFELKAEVWDLTEPKLRIISWPLLKAKLEFLKRFEEKISFDSSGIFSCDLFSLGLRFKSSSSKRFGIEPNLYLNLWDKRFLIFKLLFNKGKISIKASKKILICLDEYLSIQTQKDRNDFYARMDVNQLELILQKLEKKLATELKDWFYELKNRYLKLKQEKNLFLDSYWDELISIYKEYSMELEEGDYEG